MLSSLTHLTLRNSGLKHAVDVLFEGDKGSMLSLAEPE